MDIADWMFGSHFETVNGVGGISYFKDGRDVFDSVQLIFRYPKGQRLMSSYISTNQHLPLFGGARAQFGELVIGDQRDDSHHRRHRRRTSARHLVPRTTKKTPNPGATKAAVASASLASTGKHQGSPHPPQQGRNHRTGQLRQRS